MTTSIDKGGRHHPVVRAPGAAHLSAAGTGEPTTGPADGTAPAGRITIADRVVAALAAQVASEQPDAGAPAGRVLGLAVPGPALLGGRDADLASRPRVSATVDGSVARVEVTMSVRWPASVRAVTEGVRSAIRRRVGELAGLDVVEVRIHVTDLATTDSAATPPRVR